MTPGSGMGRKLASGSGMNNPDHIFLSLETIFFCFLGVKILKFFDEDPGSGMETVRIRDPGWKKVGSGIRDKHPGSATLNEWDEPGRDNLLCSGLGCPRLPRCRRVTGRPAFRREALPGPTSPRRNRSPQPCSNQEYTPGQHFVEKHTHQSETRRNSMPEKMTRNSALSEIKRNFILLSLTLR